jgi:hypothetical protein
MAGRAFSFLFPSICREASLISRAQAGTEQWFFRKTDADKYKGDS